MDGIEVVLEDYPNHNSDIDAQNGQGGNAASEESKERQQA